MKATLEDRLEFIGLIRQSLRTATIKDPSKKKEYSLAAFASILDIYIPHSNEFEISAEGYPHICSFTANQLATNAKHLAKTAGFDEGRLPRHQVFDNVLQRYRQVPLNAWGNVIINPDTDADIRNFMEEYAKLPKRMFQKAIHRVTEIINESLSEPIVFSNEEHLSSLIIVTDVGSRYSIESNQQLRDQRGQDFKAD